MGTKKAKDTGAPSGASSFEPTAESSERLAIELEQDAAECIAEAQAARTEEERQFLTLQAHQSAHLAAIYKAAARSKKASEAIKETKAIAGVPAWHAECAKAARAWLAVEGRNPRNVASAMAARFPYGPKAIRDALRKAGVI